MLYTILIVLLTIDSVVLIIAILLQSGQGQGLAATFGGVSSSASSLFGTRQTGNLLTKASWWCGGLFLFWKPDCIRGQTIVTIEPVAYPYEISR